jgi:phosphohistidine phosphatase
MDFKFCLRIYFQCVYKILTTNIFTFTVIGYYNIEMKHLFIVRHAKSDWEGPSGDFYRPLAKRGVSDAGSVARHVRPLLPEPLRVWSSTAKRASTTAGIFAEEIGFPVNSINFKDELYTFDSGPLSEIIKSCSNDVESLMVFGHNEAITDFVNKFGDILIDNVPTSGFVSITFDTEDWKAIRKGKTGKVIFPRDLNP